MTATIPKTALGFRGSEQWRAEFNRETEAWTLAHAVGAVVRDVAENSLRRLRTWGAGDSNNKRLLALLTWSYARQVFSSKEIIGMLRSQAAGEFWQGVIPEEADVRKYRDENRAVLEKCLCAALRFQASQKLAEGFVTRLNDAQTVQEATRRVIMAMFIDSLEQIPLS